MVDRDDERPNAGGKQDSASSSPEKAAQNKSAAGASRDVTKEREDQARSHNSNPGAKPTKSAESTEDDANKRTRGGTSGGMSGRNTK